jgi:transposase InsO family protein
MCRALSVSRSGYYAWRKKGKSKQEIENEKLLEIIIEIYEQSKKRYGGPRVWKALKNRGIDCGKNRVARLMKKAGMISKRRKKFKATTNSKHNLPVAPNLINQDFTADQPNDVWVSDITYIWTYAGWLYLCIILDLYNRQIVGWSIKPRMTKELVLESLDKAIKNQRPSPGLIFHSDRGSQYASHKVRELLEKHQIRQSMSKKGDCFDNAVAESFFASLKTECVYLEKFYTREQAISEIFEYIEIFYNRQRIHSTLNFQVPVLFDFRKKLLNCVS